MRYGLPVKKLFLTAIISSLLVGLLGLAPNVINSRPVTPDRKFFMMLLALALTMFSIWCINIGVLWLTEKVFKARLPAYVRYVLSFFVCYILIFLSTDLINSFVHHPEQRQAHMYAVYIFMSVVNTIVLIMQDLVLVRRAKSTMELENAELRVKNAEATNQQLKQQLHPHFLFNSLSTLKTLITKDPVQAEDYLVKLSDFLRASLLSKTPNTVTLAEEITHCQNYLDMQKMRFGKALQYSINIPAAMQSSLSVPVFSLLLLLENAIKHNKLTQESPLYISVEYKEGRIIISNNLQAKTVAEPSTGLGLENLAERYRILSGDEVIITNTGDTFTVSIKAIPNENSDHRG